MIYEPMLLGSAVRTWRQKRSAVPRQRAARHGSEQDHSPEYADSAWRADRMLSVGAQFYCDVVFRDSSPMSGAS
jgi:hypothetical protein